MWPYGKVLIRLNPWSDINGLSLHYLIADHCCISSDRQASIGYSSNFFFSFVICQKWKIEDTFFHWTSAQTGSLDSKWTQSVGCPKFWHPLFVVSPCHDFSSLENVRRIVSVMFLGLTTSGCRQVASQSIQQSDLDKYLSSHIDSCALYSGLSRPHACGVCRPFSEHVLCNVLTNSCKTLVTLVLIAVSLQVSVFWHSFIVK